MLSIVFMIVAFILSVLTGILAVRSTATLIATTWQTASRVFAVIYVTVLLWYVTPMVIPIAADFGRELNWGIKVAWSLNQFGVYLMNRWVRRWLATIIISEIVLFSRLHLRKETRKMANTISFAMTILFAVIAGTLGVCVTLHC
ncbi:hypothetical protein FJZ55_05335 [Candidatus Woesearchaeota archaeon]|nr:hypothetical protein [Candidatus Woesearchaeota archaeon]MBM4077128.1 hypothetical protein [Planctomycetota bacterium]